MSNEVRLDPMIINGAIADLRTNIEALEASFAREIEGENNLDMVDSFNEIKVEYEELLKQYKLLFLNNVQTTEEAVESLRQLDKTIGTEIGNAVSNIFNMVAK